MDPPDKIRVLINVDETSVRLVPQEGKGHVSKSAYRLLCSGMPLGRHASLAAQRSAISHVAAICDHPEIQKRLPQVVLVGENQFTEARANRVRSEAPEIVHLWRLKKAWFEQIWPKGMRIPIHDLFLPVERFLRGIAEDPSPPPEEVIEVNTWLGRTRSTSALVASSSSSVLFSSVSFSMPYHNDGQQ